MGACGLDLLKVCCICMEVPDIKRNDYARAKQVCEMFPFASNGPTKTRSSEVLMHSFLRVLVSKLKPMVTSHIV